MMHRLLLSLWAVLLPSSLLAEKTKTFKFTDDFYLKFLPLESAIGPENVGVLTSALSSYAEQFKSVWIQQIEASLLGGGVCTVDGMALPEFSFCEWKYPDKYDVDVLPIAGQCYENMYGFIQRGYYKIKDLEITCPDNFYFDDLDKDVSALKHICGCGYLYITFISNCAFFYSPIPRVLCIPLRPMSMLPFPETNSRI